MALTASKPILLSTALNGSVESLVPDTGMDAQQLLKFVLTEADAATVESALTTLNGITKEVSIFRLSSLIYILNL